VRRNVAPRPFVDRRCGRLGAGLISSAAMTKGALARALKPRWFRALALPTSRFERT